MSSPRPSLWVFWSSLGCVLLVLLACRNSRQAPGEASSSVETPAPSATPPAATPGPSVLIAYGSEKKSWFEAEIKEFNRAQASLPGGARVEGRAMGSGEALQDVLEGRLRPAVFSPASSAYITLLNDAWTTRTGRPSVLAPSSDSVVISPVVIAMWKPMAEALGHPGKRLGWHDVIEVARSERGWAAYGRPEWGSVKLGHTHPEYSNSGLLSFLAEAYAGAEKTRELTLEDLASKKTRSFLEAVESKVVHYGKSTGFFAEKMLARGPSYLSAAVLYESSVIESYSQQGSGLPLVSIYPREGALGSSSRT
jgi:Ca-activated chloride channel family protein